MRTTLKRGIGRAAATNGNGRAAYPPSPPSPVSLYRQPEAPARGGRSVAARVLGWAGLVLVVVLAGVAGGGYLYAHESVAALAPDSHAERAAAEQLDIPTAGQPATALVIGYDRRENEAKGTPSRSDTLMLLRADPNGKTISLLSFPRDMTVPIYCPGRSPYTGKINTAFTFCGPRATLDTVRNLTGLPVNYIITVNFQGFRQLVDKLGGVWIDVDRRYFNDFSGPSGYATINLLPGYQHLNGYQALDFVRYRHTDSDLFRVARQQLFVRAFKDQVRHSFSAKKLPSVVRVVRNNVTVGQGGGKDVSLSTILSYAALAYDLPAGHVFQSRIEGLEGYAELTTSSENIQRAVQQFAHPDVDAPKKATAVALGEKVKLKAPPARDTTVTVLNGNGLAGAATNASSLLGERGYQMVLPPNGIPANAPTFDYFRTKVFFDPGVTGAKLAARRVANLFGSADVAKMPAAIRTLSNGAMLVGVVGQTFHDRLAAAPVDQTPKRQVANVVPGAEASLDLLRDRQRRVRFPLMVPTVIDRSSWIDRERPIRLYRIDPARKHKAVRLVYRMGSNEYWGVQMTDWADAPVLASRSFVRNIGGRRYELFYDGPRLHMVALRTKKGTYWVVNTLLDRLSNETMIAIAKGLRPVAKVK
jgi:LCP family protein required for cell wall assembly